MDGLKRPTSRCFCCWTFLVGSQKYPKNLNVCWKPQVLHTLKGTLSRYGWPSSKHSSRVTNWPSSAGNEGFPRTWAFQFQNKDCPRQTRMSWLPYQTSGSWTSLIAFLALHVEKYSHGMFWFIWNALCLAAKLVTLSFFKKSGEGS